MASITQTVLSANQSKTPIQTPAATHLLINQMRRAKQAGNPAELELLQKKFDIALKKQALDLQSKHTEAIDAARKKQHEMQVELDKYKSKKELEEELDALLALNNTTPEQNQRMSYLMQRLDTDPEKYLYYKLSKEQQNAKQGVPENISTTEYAKDENLLESNKGGGTTIPGPSPQGKLSEHGRATALTLLGGKDYTGSPVGAIDALRAKGVPENIITQEGVDTATIPGREMADKEKKTEIERLALKTPEERRLESIQKMIDDGSITEEMGSALMLEGTANDVQLIDAMIKRRDAGKMTQQNFDDFMRGFVGTSSGKKSVTEMHSDLVASIKDPKMQNALEMALAMPGASVAGSRGFAEAFVRDLEQGDTTQAYARLGKWINDYDPQKQATELKKGAIKLKDLYSDFEELEAMGIDTSAWMRFAFESMADSKLSAFKLLKDWIDDAVAEMTPDQKKKVSKVWSKQGRFLADFIKSISGAAATDNEADRLAAILPGLGTSPDINRGFFTGNLEYLYNTQMAHIENNLPNLNLSQEVMSAMGWDDLTAEAIGSKLPEGITEAMIESAREDKPKASRKDLIKELQDYLEDRENRSDE